MTILESVFDELKFHKLGDDLPPLLRSISILFNFFRNSYCSAINYRIKFLNNGMISLHGSYHSHSKLHILCFFSS